MAPRKGNSKKEKSKNKAESNHLLDPYAQNREPSWETALKGRIISDDAWKCRVYMVCAADVQYVDLADYIGTSIFTGCRAKFVLIDYLDIAEMLRSRKGLEGVAGGGRSSKKSAGGSSKTSRGTRATEAQGYGPVEEMFRTAATMFQTTRVVCAPVMACLVKHEIAEIKRESTTIIEFELPGTTNGGPKSKQSKKDVAASSDSKPGASKAVPAGEERRTSKLTPSESRRDSRRTSARRKTVKQVEEIEQKKEQKQPEDEDDFCATKRKTKLVKRGENDDSSINFEEIVMKDDEPVGGPDMYVILAGFHQSDLPIEMEKRGIPVEVLYRVATKPGLPMGATPFRTTTVGLGVDLTSQTSLETVPEGVPTQKSSLESAELLDQSQKLAAFWGRLSAGMISGDAALVPPNFVTSELQIPLHTIRCSTDHRQAGDFMFDLLAEKIYDHLKMRAIFDCYLANLSITNMPDISSVFPSLMPADVEEDSTDKPERSGRNDSSDPRDGDSPSPPTLHRTPEPVLYKERLDSVPPEAVSVPMIVSALVDQVACWLTEAVAAAAESAQSEKSTTSASDTHVSDEDEADKLTQSDSKTAVEDSGDVAAAAASAVEAAADGNKGSVEATDSPQAHGSSAHASSSQHKEPMHHHRASIDASSHLKMASVDASIDADPHHRRSSVDASSHHKRLSVDASMDADPHHRRPSVDASSHHRRPSVNVSSSHRRGTVDAGSMSQAHLGSSGSVESLHGQRGLSVEGTASHHYGGRRRSSVAVEAGTSHTRPVAHQSSNLPAMKGAPSHTSPGVGSPHRRDSRRMSVSPALAEASEATMQGMTRSERHVALDKSRTSSVALQMPPLSYGLLAGSEELEESLRAESTSRSLDDDWPVMKDRRLCRHFPRKDPITETAPVLVYHRDSINAQFYNRTDRSMVHQLESVLRQSWPAQQLDAAPVPSDASFLKHDAAKQELLQQLNNVVSSDENMEYLIRLLIFESLYPVLTVDQASPRVATYRHVSLPAPHVPVDQQLIAPECGHVDSCDELRLLFTNEQTCDVVSRFRDYCWVERLDPLSMALTIHELESRYSLLAGRHFEGDDGLYLIYGHPRVFDGNQEEKWRYRLHSTVGFRDFIEHLRSIPAVGRWFDQQKDRLIKGERLEREDAKRRGEIKRLQPVPDPPPLKNELEEDHFVLPGSIKGHPPPENEKGQKSDLDKYHATEKQPAKPDENTAELGKEKSGGKERKSNKSKGKDTDKSDGKKDKDKKDKDTKKKKAGKETIEIFPVGDWKEKNPQPVQEINSGGRLLTPEPPNTQFCGFDLAGQLVHLSTRCSRHYFDNDSYVSVEASEYVRGSRALSVAVTHGETRVQVNPQPQGEDVVIHLLGGCVLHLCPKVVTPPVGRPPHPDLPAGPESGEASRRSSGSRRRSPTGSSSKEKPNKKDAKKKIIGGRGSRRTLNTKGSRGAAPSGFEDLDPDLLSPMKPTVPVVPTAVQTLRLCCPSGLVIEVEPDPYSRAPEPHVLVRQYYLDSDCRRSGVRLFVSEGTVARLDDGEEGDVDLLGPDGSLMHCACIKERTVRTKPGPVDTPGASSPRSPQPERERPERDRSGARKPDKTDKPESPPSPSPAPEPERQPEFVYRLQPLSQVLANGQRREYDPLGDELPPVSYLTKMATDPVTKELYVVRQDGVTAVLRPGGQSVIQHADGTRLTLSVPSPEQPLADEQVPVCSDYIVNDAGWIVGDRISWVMGVRVLISDAATNDWDVRAEHPDYCRVTMRQLSGTCQVHAPQGTVIEATSDGNYTVQQADGTCFQISLDVASFSIPPADGAGGHPTVHTFPLTRPKLPVSPAKPETLVHAVPWAEVAGTEEEPTSHIGIPEVVVNPPTEECLVVNGVEGDGCSNTLCETVDSQRRVFRATRNGRLFKAGDRDTCSASGLTLAMRAQLERGTVLPQRPRLLVLYREGDGAELLPSSDVSRYLSFVQASRGGQVWRDDHLADPEVSTLRIFRPVASAEMPECRWKMPYVEDTLVPPNLRSRDMSLLCTSGCNDSAAMHATWWGSGDFEPKHRRKPSPPPKLIHTRELVHIPPVQEGTYREVVEAVHRTRLRRQNGAAGDHKPVTLGSDDQTPRRRNVHLFEANRLIQWLEAARTNDKLATGEMPVPPKCSPAHWERCKRQAEKINTFKHMLHTKHFPSYFLSEEGGEFLGKVRQASLPALAPRWRQSISDHQVRLAGAPRPLPPGSVYCRPPTLDLGAVRRGDLTSGTIQLVNANRAELRYRLRPPAPLMGLRVEPRAGKIPPNSEQQLTVTFHPGETMAGRSVYFRLDVVIDGGLDLVQVPLVACVGSRDCLLPRLPAFSPVARQQGSVR